MAVFIPASSVDRTLSLRGMQTFHDLYWSWQESGQQSHRERTVMAVRLGVDLYAHSFGVSDILSDRDKCSLPPLNLPALQAGNTDLQEALRMQQGLPWKHNKHTEIQQLTRLTLATEDSNAAAQAFTGTRAVAATYDLLSIQPLSERVFQQVWHTCVTSSARLLPYQKPYLVTS